MSKDTSPDGARGFRDLLQRARAGDRAAMDELLAIVRPCLAAAARRYEDAGASRSASDLVQDAEFRAWQRLGQFEAEGGGGRDDGAAFARFRAWILQIVRRLAIDIQRERHAQKRLAPGRGVLSIERGAGGRSSPGASGGGAGLRGVEPVGNDPTASVKLQERERAEAVRTAVAALPNEIDRRIVKLYFFDGVSLREAAERLALPYHRVKERYRAAVRQLERMLRSL